MLVGRLDRATSFGRGLAGNGVRSAMPIVELRVAAVPGCALRKSAGVGEKALVLAYVSALPLLCRLH